jgi:hypothetical protein
MGDAGIVRRVGRAGYAFAKDPGVATLADLYEATVAPVSELLPEEWSEVSEDFARAASRMREGLKQPLSSLRSIAGDAPGGP